MQTISLQDAADIVEKHKSELPLSTDQDKEAYVQRLKKIIEQIADRGPEDFRQAATMAIDASKSLLQIAIAVFIAMGGFMQFAFKANLDWDSLPIILFSVAAGLSFLSMCAGFFAVGNSFKRGEGRIDKNAPNPWSTAELKPYLLSQSLLGMFALLAFAAGIVFWNVSDGGATKSLMITVPQGSMKAQYLGKSITLEGEWSKLIVKQKGIFAVDLGTVPKGRTQSFSITME